MKLEQVLARIDTAIVRVEKGNGRIALFLRTSRNPQHFARWKVVIEEFLIAAAEKRAKKEGWGSDVSQAYYVNEDGAVRYLWRVIITGAGLREGAEAFGRAVLRSLGQGIMVTEMPLIGRKEYPFDPVNGKMKGAYVGSEGGTSAQAMVAVQIGMGGGGQ